MKKIIPLLLLSLIILCPIIAESADATTLISRKELNQKPMGTLL